MLRLMQGWEEYLESLTTRGVRPPGIALPTFIELSLAITTEWQTRRRRDGRKKVDGESANEWFKRYAYKLIRLYIRAGKEDVFAVIIAKNNRHPAGRALVEHHPFKMGLLAMFPNADGLARHERRRFAEQMQYAHLHKVKPEHFNGFAARAGPTEEIVRKIKADVRVQGFKVPPLA